MELVHGITGMHRDFILRYDGRYALYVRADSVYGCVSACGPSAEENHRAGNQRSAAFHPAKPAPDTGSAASG